jgi:hypothetical protein
VPCCAVLPDVHTEGHREASKAFSMVHKQDVICASCHGLQRDRKGSGITQVQKPSARQGSRYVFHVSQRRWSRKYVQLLAMHPMACAASTQHEHDDVLLSPTVWR